MSRRSNQERGQVLLVVAFGLVVLLAISALVIDLGFSWMLRRHEQNAVDPAAVAAARWLRDSLGNPTNPAAVQGEMNADACFYAQQNNFFQGDTDCAAALASGDLQVHSPPIDGPYAGIGGHVQVIIHATHPAFFARIWGHDREVVVTGAVAANTAQNANSSSLVALKPTCDGGSAGSITGGGTVRIFPVNPGDPGGYVHVNSPCGGSTDDNCANGVGSAALDISGGGTLITPFAYTVGSCVVNGSGSNPDPDGLWCDDSFTSNNCLDEGALPIADPLAGLPEPQLDAFPNGVCPDGTTSTPSSTSACNLKRSSYCPDDAVDPTIGVCTLSPGVYYGGWSVGSKVRLQLRPGLYILAGGGIKLSGASSSIEAVTSTDGTTEARVTIFSTDGPGCPSIAAQCQGTITFTASQAFKAKATNLTSCQQVLADTGVNTCPWKGILLWQDGTASNPTAAVKLGGQESTVLAGTIYAPLANVQIDGGSDTTGCTVGPTEGCLSIQIISYTWQINGGALVEMPYDPSELAQPEQRGLVH